MKENPLWHVLSVVLLLLVVPAVLAADGAEESDETPGPQRPLAFGDFGKTDLVCEAAGGCGGGPGGGGGSGGGGGGGCTPNWVIISSQAVGGFAVQSFSPPGCDYYGVTSYTWHDTNGCGDPDYQTCSISFHTFRSDGACCVYYWCGGNTCGYI